MAHRVNWEMNTTSKKYNFIWRYSNKKIDYKELNYNDNLPRSQIKIANIIENHEYISNKKLMFINLMEYCNVRNKYKYIIIFYSL